VVDGLLRRLHNAHYKAQGCADNVVLLQNSKIVSTLCDRMQGALHCVENWCRDIGLSVNSDKTTMVLFTSNRKIGSFYNPRLFGTKLRMTNQVKCLGVILDKKLDWKAHLENRMQKACIAYWQSSSCCGKDLKIITEGGSLAILVRGVAHSFVCFDGMVESGAKKCSEKVISLVADDVFGNYWWYAFNTNVCFRG
jgi:hypothetical protein